MLFRSVYVSFAIPLSYYLDANYCNFLESVIPFMENIRLESGQVVYTVLVCLALTLGMAFGAVVYYFLYRGLSLSIAAAKRFVRRKATEK